MKRWKLCVLIGMTTAGFAIAGTAALSPDVARRPPGADMTQQFEQLSDAHERTTGRIEDEGVDAGEANRRNKLLPGEVRPGNFVPRFKFP
ncbi:MULTISPECIES: hypothetical protein [unclassified Dietzia]|uniref:hypothetical protein n=1 Tax=unclassified Dietzia TaxID=2617939 RepID=UPI0012E7CA23|nr:MULTISPECIES: hypothetical protein [unclassified Dietzia]